MVRQTGKIYTQMVDADDFRSISASWVRNEWTGGKCKLGKRSRFAGLENVAKLQRGGYCNAIKPNMRKSGSLNSALPANILS